MPAPQPTLQAPLDQGTTRFLFDKPAQHPLENLGLTLCNAHGSNQDPQALPAITKDPDSGLKAMIIPNDPNHHRNV